MTTKAQMELKRQLIDAIELRALEIAALDLPWPDRNDTIRKARTPYGSLLAASDYSQACVDVWKAAGLSPTLIRTGRTVWRINPTHAAHKAVAKELSRLRGDRFSAWMLDTGEPQPRAA